MSATDEWVEVRQVRLGVTVNVHRSDPIWNDTKVSACHRIDPWQIRGSVADLIEFLATYPPEADVHIDDGDLGGNPGEITIDWTDDATADDIAGRDARAEAARQAQAELDAFEAWKAARPLPSPVPGDGEGTEPRT